MNQPIEFRTLSLAAARSFLRTAAVFDDEATMSQPTAPADASLIVPDTFRDIEEAIGDSAPEDQIQPSSGASDLESAELSTPSHNLDAGEVMEAFAAVGIFCTVIQPRPEGDGSPPPESVAAATIAQQADILVLDWQIAKDNGRASLDLLEHVVQNDVAAGRTRFVAIYTGEDRLDDIEGKLFEHLKPSLADLQVARPGVVSSSRMHVVLLKKEGTARAPQGYEGRTVDFPDLPKRLIEEFAQSCGGLLPNLALAALGQVRARSQPILSHFSAQLDGAFVSDRVLRDHPEENEDFAISLVTQEIEAALTPLELGVYVSANAITAWLDRDHTPLAWQDGRGHPMDLDTSIGGRLVTEGRGIEPPNNARSFRKALSFTQMFGRLSEEQAASVDHRFALLSHMASLPSDAGGSGPPAMQCGVIVQARTAGTLLLCIQPPCDSLRLQASREFIFIRLAKVDVGDKFSLVLHDDHEQPMYVRADLTSYGVAKVTFDPAPSGGAVAAPPREPGQPWTWMSSGPTSAPYDWLGTVRPLQAQRMAQAFARSVDRIGLDESEWARRMRDDLPG
jgi:hypothetical protein